MSSGRSYVPYGTERLSLCTVPVLRFDDLKYLALNPERGPLFLPNQCTITIPPIPDQAAEKTRALCGNGPHRPGIIAMCCQMLLLSVHRLHAKIGDEIASPNASTPTWKKWIIWYCLFGLEGCSLVPRSCPANRFSDILKTCVHGTPGRHRG